MNADATEELKELFGVTKIFSHPKPTKLLRNIVSITAQDGDLVLDFFSGSGTTADAVMQIACERTINLRYILVQLPENLEESLKYADNNAKPSLEAAIEFLAGQHKPLVLSELAKERIRRAGEKIKAEANEAAAQNLDTGFRVLKLDDTNMNDVYYAPGEYTQEMLPEMESNIKPDRTDMDLLFACLLDWGLPLSMPHTHETIDGFTVHTYNGGDLIACFQERISEKAIREIAARKPLRAVFRDSSFTSSPEKINVFEIFKMITPNTSIRVI